MAMRDWAQALVARARADGVELTGDGGLLTGLVRQVLQAGLEVEMEDHLGCAAHDPVGRGSGNSRNGSYPKTVTTEVGQVELAVPRDRAGSFEPVIVPKSTLPASVNHNDPQLSDTPTCCEAAEPLKPCRINSK